MEPILFLLMKVMFSLFPQSTVGPTHLEARLCSEENHGGLP